MAISKSTCPYRARGAWEVVFYFEGAIVPSTDGLEEKRFENMITRRKSGQCSKAFYFRGLESFESENQIKISIETKNTYIK